MGVDISGRNPIARSPKPEINWDTATEQEKDKYFVLNEVWQKENPGDYFRANWWSWRPLVVLIDMANHQYDLGIDVTTYGNNDGGGLETHEDCNKLADALEKILGDNHKLIDEDDTIYLVSGSWVDLDGHFIDPEISKKFTEECDTHILYNSFVAEDGTIAQPAHGTSVWKIRAFISFLRECGGFEIW